MLPKDSCTWFPWFIDFITVKKKKKKTKEKKTKQKKKKSDVVFVGNLCDTFSFPIIYIYISPYTSSHVELWVLSLILAFCFSYTWLHFSFILVMFFLLVYQVSTHWHYPLYFWSLYYSSNSLEHIPEPHPHHLCFFHPFSWMVVYLCNTPTNSFFFFIDFHLLINSVIDIIKHLWGSWPLSFLVY